MNVCLLGFGYWGPNLARNLNSFDGLSLHSIIDQSRQARDKASHLYPNVYIEEDLTEDIIEDCECFVIATPINSHYQIAHRLLSFGKHVLVQKPLCNTYEEAKQLKYVAEETQSVLMTSHTFVFSPAITHLKKMITEGELGALNYISSTRINLGLIQRSNDIFSDLAPHDFSIINYLVNEKPAYVSATAASHNSSNSFDCANISMGFETGLLANVHLNWLSPVKNRTFIISGHKKTAIFDDCSHNKLSIYDCNVEWKEKDNRFSYNKGDIICPKLDEREPIFFEIQEFFNSIQEKRQSISGGQMSLEVVRQIEVARFSARNNGVPFSLQT